MIRLCTATCPTGPPDSGGCRTGTGSAAVRRSISSTRGASAGGATSNASLTVDEVVIWLVARRAAAAADARPARPCSPRRASCARRSTPACAPRSPADARCRRPSALIDDWLALAGLAARAGGRPRRSAGALRARDAPTRRGARSAMVALRRRAHARHRRPSATRVRICGSDTCSARFYDRSPAGAPALVLDGGVRQREKARRHRRSARCTRMSDDVQSGLEGVVAFATEIAEPDREGGALRYRGVDIEELVGNVPFEQVWGLLVDGTLRAGPAARRAAPAGGPLRRPARRRAGGAGDARAGVGLAVADRHLRRAGARRPRPRLGDGAVVRRAVGARRRPPAGAAARGRQGRARSPSAS